MNRLFTFQVQGARRLIQKQYLGVSDKGTSNGISDDDSKNQFRVIADWKDAKITKTYMNKVSESFEKEYVEFKNSLNYICNVDDFVVQQKYFKALVVVLSTGSKGRLFLKEIISQTELPDDFRKH